MVFVRPIYADGIITNGSSTTDIISAVGEIDTWTFSASANDRIYVQVGVSSGASLNPRIYLYDPYGNEIGQDSGFTSTSIVQTAPWSGTYTVTVQDYAPQDGTGTYTLYLASIPGDFTVLAGDEGGVLTNGGMHTGSIDLGDLDMWTFQADARDTLLIQISEDGSTAFEPEVTLYGPDGSKLAPSALPGATSISYQALVAAGTYTVVVRDGNVDVAGSGDYTMYFANVPGPYSLPAGDEGGALTDGGVHAGSIDLGDLDLWTLQADALDTISLQVNEVLTTGLNPQIVLYGPDGSKLSTAAITTSITEQALVAGTYTVVVMDGNADVTGTGDYELSYALTPDLTPVPGGPILAALQNGGRVSASFDTPGDIDKYSLMVNTGDSVRIHVADITGNGSVRSGLRVFSGDGSLIGESMDAEVARVSYTAEATETLTVVVFNALGNIGDYDVFTTVAPQSFVTPAGDEGGILANGSVATGTWTLGDMDLYSLAVNAGDKVLVQVGDTLATGHVTPALQVYSGDGSLIGKSTGGEVTRVSYIAEATETLTVVVFNNSDYPGTYNLFAAVAPQSFVIPAGDEGGVLGNGIVASGTWTIADVDLYTFSVLNGANVSLALEEPTDLIRVSPSLQVFSSDGSLMGKSTGASSAQVNFIADSTDTLVAVVFNNVTTRTDPVNNGSYNLLATNIASLDSDSDGLSDALELMIGTSRSDSDTDNDGVSDFDEVNYDGNASAYNPAADLNPLNIDTDGDGIDDATELLHGTNPLDPNDFTLGDINFDGQVDLADYLLLTRFVLGIGSTPTAAELSAGDMNQNDQFDAGDLVIHLRTIMGLM